MAENEIKNWETARVQLVKQRQGLIRTLAEGYERERENLIDYLIKIQAGIDALDKTKHEIFIEEGHEARPR
jgi:DNA repair ATPase RecN